MKRLLTYILIAVMVMCTLSGCSFFEEEDKDTTVVASIESFPESKEEALVGSKNYPAEATEGFTMDGYEAKFDYKVVHEYIGEKCEDKLKEMGEDLEGYYWDSDCDHVLYEVEIKVSEMNEKKKFTGADVIFSEIFKKNKKTKIESGDFFNVGIVDSAKSDLNQDKIKLKPSEEAVVLYQLVELPSETKEFYSKEYDKNGSAFWIHYEVADF